MINAAVQDDVGRVTLARPEKRNALTPEMLTKLTASIRDTAPACNALLIDAEGETFCAGFDLKMCHADDAALEAMLRGLAETIDAIRSIEIPVVIAAQGGAIAGGCAMLAVADVVVTNADAKLGYPVVRLGISPAVSAPTLAPAVGSARTRERMLDPTLIDGKRAAAIGLAHVCTERADDVIPEAERIAFDLASKPPASLRATRAWVRELEDATAPAGAVLDALATSLDLVGSTEQRERLAAMWAR